MMNDSFMHHLYFGDFVPWERKRSTAPEYESITRKISDLKAYFRDTLSPEDYEKFEELEDLQVTSGTIEEVDTFEYGFSMATLMMMNVLHFKDTHLTE